MVVSVPLPQTVEFESAIDRPAGSVSLTATPVSVVATFGFVSVNVRLVVALSGIDEDANAFGDRRRRDDGDIRSRTLGRP